MTLAGLFAVQVKRSPEAEAVVFGSERLTYRELDRRSNMAGESEDLRISN